MKRRRFIGTVLASTSAAVVAGCSSNGDGGDANDDGGDGGTPEDGDATTESGDGDTVAVTGSTFDPLRLSVEPGTEVLWQNEDAYAHAVVADQFHDKAADWSMNSRIIANTGQATHTFEEAGVYEYYCSIHEASEMCGAILVGDVSLEESLPCEEG